VNKKSAIQTLLEKSFPEKTDLAIRVMMMGFEKIREEIIRRLQTNIKNSEAIKIIKELE